MIDRPLYIFTMTAGLGDLVVLGSLERWITRQLPEAHCFIVHRNNPHTSLWQSADTLQKFYNIHSPLEILKLVKQAKQLRNEGYTVFGIQMAPGSLQGYFFLRGLQKIGAVDYVADFNLINADIITPTLGEYILQRHARQMLTLCHIPDTPLPQRPTLPFNVSERLSSHDGLLRVGLHPWSRRSNQVAFIWQREKWLALIQHLERHTDVGEIVIVGKDAGFDSFKSVIITKTTVTKMRFAPSGSVPELVNELTALDLLVTVNTGVVHLAHAIDLPQVILNGPSLDLWIPKGENIIALYDQQATWHAPDRAMKDQRFSSISNIKLEEVLWAVEKLSLLCI